MRTRLSGTDPIIDTLPPGVQFVSASSDQGTCTAESGRPVTCVVVVEEPGTATVTIVVIPTQCGDFTNTAQDTASRSPLAAQGDFPPLIAMASSPYPARLPQLPLQQPQLARQPPRSSLREEFRAEQP